MSIFRIGLADDVKAISEMCYRVFFVCVCVCCFERGWYRGLNRVYDRSPTVPFDSASFKEGGEGMKERERERERERESVTDLLFANGVINQSSQAAALPLHDESIRFFFAFQKEKERKLDPFFFSLHLFRPRIGLTAFFEIVVW